MSEHQKQSIGRPKSGRTVIQQKEFLKMRSRIYYSTEVNKVLQKERMLQYRIKNREKIYSKQKQTRLLKSIEKRLKKIWISKGFIV